VLRDHRADGHDGRRCLPEVRVLAVRPRSEYDVPDDVFMALELIPGALNERAGTIRYHPAFAAAIQRQAQPLELWDDAAFPGTNQVGR
jgi:hypothetical protein